MDKNAHAQISLKWIASSHSLVDKIVKVLVIKVLTYSF